MCKECNCKSNETLKVDIIKHSPYATLERNGDLIDLNYCGLDRVFRGEINQALTDREFKNKTHDWKDDYTLVPKPVECITYNKGDIFRVSLGISMRLPEGKMAKVVARSGTRKNFNVMLTNALGQIDNGYQGTNDVWLAEFVALDNGIMALGDRILQFEITDVMPEVIFNEVKTLSLDDRGGYGSTGI